MKTIYDNLDSKTLLRVRAGMEMRQDDLPFGSEAYMHYDSCMAKIDKILYGRQEETKPPKRRFGSYSR